MTKKAPTINKLIPYIQLCKQNPIYKFLELKKNLPIIFFLKICVCNIGFTLKAWNHH